MKRNKILIALPAVLLFFCFPLSAQLSGVYSINQSSPTAGSNFNNFSDLAAALATSGVNGKVVVNVATAVYTSAVSFQQAAGVSATKNIVINGNSATITAQGISGQPWTLGLNGADHMIFRQLNVIGTGTQALTCHLYNGADNNLFYACSFQCPSGSTSPLQVPFSISGSGLYATTLGLAGRSNTVTACAMKNGYFAASVFGNSSTPFSSANIFQNCTADDFYTTGIMLSEAPFTLLKLCNLQRKAATVVSTFNGCYIMGNSEGIIVEGLRIGYPGGAIPSPTMTAYGIYIYTSGTTSNPIMIRNNLFYEFNSAGILYGICAFGSNIRMYHNTVSFDQAASTSTSAAYGIYKLGYNNKIMNNLISLKRGGNGVRFGLYYADSLLPVNSQCNFIHSPGPNGYYGYNSGAHVTWNNWKINTAMDMNGGDADPAYMEPAAGNFMPLASAIVDKGTSAGVITDIQNIKRHLVTPDPGAFESVCNACTSINGRFFSDCNSNCTYESSEPGIGQFLKVKIFNSAGIDITVTPDASGMFSLIIPGQSSLALTHSTSATNFTACSNASILIPPGGAQVVTNIGYKITPYDDPAVRLTRMSPVFVNGGVTFLASGYNGGATPPCAGSLPAIPGKIKVVLRPYLTYKNMVTGPAPTVISATSGDTLMWNVADLYNTGPRSFSVVMTQSVGSTYVLESHIQPTSDNNLTNNSVTNSETRQPYDPNNKIVYAAGMLDNGDLPSGSSNELFYTINFQNVGQAPAINVRTLDTLDAKLDWTTLKVLQSSFPVSASTDQNNGITNFMFRGIMLPDSATDEPGSHGFVRYSVMMKGSVTVGDVIRNRAHNYFDDLAPVATNLAVTKIVSTVGLRDDLSGKGIMFYPNPAGEKITVSGSGLRSAQIMNLLGQTMREESISGESTQLDLRGLPSGVYILYLDTEGERQSFKIVKE
jgi:hypothetical protein